MNNPLSVESGEEPKMKKYFKLPALIKGGARIVKIGSVESPESLTVHFQYSGGYFLYTQMQAEMQEVTEPEPLRLVEVDNACLIKVREVFYRGKVVGIEGEKVTVLLVDTGEEQVRQLNNVYEIEERFTNVAETTQKVKLACVRPVDGTSNWSDYSTSALRERIKGKEFLMFVQEEKDEKTPLSVILYETHHNKDICINFWLFSVHQATLTSDACMRLEYFKPAVEISPVEVEEEETDIYNTFEARVVALQSPSNISVIYNQNEPDLEKLHFQMKKHYGNSKGDRKSQSRDLTLGALVAAHIDKNGGLWVRGKIKEVDIKEGKAGVQLMDYEETKKIKVEKLRPLAKMFNKVFMEKVHLAGVSPTSDSGDWSKDATEKLREILQKSSMKVQLQCLGKSTNRSLPVKMLVVDDTGELVDVEDLMVAADMARARCKRIAELVRPSAEREEIEIKQWQPAEQLQLGTNIERATATFVDWSGRVHLVKDLTTVGLISRVLAAKYNNSKMRPVDRYWSVGEAAVIWSEYFKDWFRAAVLLVDSLKEVCKIRFVDYGTEAWQPMEMMRKDLFTVEFNIQSFMLQLDNIQPSGDKWLEEELTLLHEKLVDQTFDVVIKEVKKEEEGEGKYYVGGLCPSNDTVTHGEDLGSFLMSQMRQISKKP